MRERVFALGLPALFVPVLVLFAVAITSPTMAHAEENVALVDQLTNEVMCQCGCTYTVNACAGAMQCDVSEQMRSLISDKVAKGESRAQIIGYFTSQYGEKVLSAPTKQGFNLTAWVTPFAAIIAGAAAVYLVLQAWVRRRGEESAPLSGELGPVDLDRYGDRVDRELEQFV
jgi:cytochrome c-type biogenesis protein CcmH